VLVSDTIKETKHGPADDDSNLVYCLKLHSVVTWVAVIRWTQWIFIQLFNKGLAYQAEVPVNWCPALGTVLANEEIIDGKSERGDHPVERMPMKQVGTLQPVLSCLTVGEPFTKPVPMYFNCRLVSKLSSVEQLNQTAYASCHYVCFGLMLLIFDTILCCSVSAALSLLLCCKSIVQGVPIAVTCNEVVCALQWMLRITQYADRLLEDLDDVDWSDSIKDMQRNWIGRSQVRLQKKLSLLS